MTLEEMTAAARAVTGGTYSVVKLELVIVPSTQVTVP